MSRVKADGVTAPKSNAAIGPAKVVMPACVSAASWNAVKSLYPIHRLRARRARKIEAIDKPRPPVTATHRDRELDGGSSAIRATAASRSSSVPAKRCQRVLHVGSITTR